jgi:cold shock CspA family protein
MLDETARCPITAPREITGYLTEVNLRYGFGFIETDQGERIYVHASAFQAAGIEFVRMGQLVHCQASCREEGWQAFRILSVGANQKQMSGKLVEKPTAVEFGSIEAGDGIRVLVTAAIFKDSGFSWFEVGHGYAFAAIERGRGLQVIRIHARTNTGVNSA